MNSIYPTATPMVDAVTVHMVDYTTSVWAESGYPYHGPSAHVIPAPIAQRLERTARRLCLAATPMTRAKKPTEDEYMEFVRAQKALIFALKGE